MTPKNRAVAFLCSAAISLTGCAGTTSAPIGGPAGTKPAGIGQAAVASATRAPSLAPAADPAHGAAPAPAATASENAPSASPYEAWGPWIGGGWVAQLAPDRDGPPRHMERRYTWGDNKAGVKLEDSGFKGDTEVDHVAGLISWNASDGKFHLQEISSDGRVGQGIFHQEGAAWVCEITQTAKNGTVTRERVLVKLVGADAATFQLFQLRGRDFVRALDLRLERRWPNI